MRNSLCCTCAPKAHSRTAHSRSRKPITYAGQSEQQKGKAQNHPCPAGPCALVDGMQNHDAPLSPTRTHLVEQLDWKGEK